FLIISILILISSGITAQTKKTLLVGNSLNKTEIGKEYVGIHKELGNNLSLETITSNNIIQFNNYSNYKDKFLRDTNYWFQFEIRNTSNKNCEYALEFIDIPYIDFYIIDKTGAVEEIRTGTLFPASKTQMKYTIRDTAVLKLQANETKTVYYKIRLVFDIQELSQVFISDTKSFIEQTTRDNLIQGIFQGLLWMMLLYNFFLYVLTHQKSYLYYVAYVFSFSVLMLYVYQYIKIFIFPEHPEIPPYFPIFVFIAFIFYFLLMREFIDSRTKHPRIDRSLKIIIKINSIISLLIFLVQLADINGVDIIGIEYVLINSIILLVFIILIFKLGNRASKIFATGTLFMIMCVSIASMATVLGGESDVLIILFQVGIVGEVFIFSIGLSYKYKTSELEKQKAQKDLIDQLTKNQELQTKVNRELEQKVKERTIEISKQKDKIQSIADHLFTANTEINRKNRNITASIEYAKRIQTAMLPDSKQLSENLSRHFILFKPRDIVSGDFYWIKKIDHTLIVAAADCTGHGVPGALVSMLGISLLNEIIIKKEHKKPNEILEKLRERIKNSLKQTNETNSTKDGMDIALCVIDTRTLNLQYAGAYNPLYIIRNNELIEIKATRNPVGISSKEKSFKNNELQLQNNDRLYIFSDGYADQFGGEKGQKFMLRKFKQLLLDVAKCTFNEQKQILNNTIENWKD
ncbi:MAG: SpoIIE family protein phosphatase, partial [Candidatus Cloacimonetes bacterium]|nr:SpoIIE family protein phosphatase [Candidatus Cloacimonadota bacterium]